ncbi:MAG: hypothetical protein ACTS3R_21100 [Inquilinaceae bacterium]
MRPAHIRSILIALLPLAAACAGQPESSPTQMSEGVAEPITVSVERFDRGESETLTARAATAAAAGREAEALALYRQAGLAWPDNRAAWEGLATMAGRRGDGAEEAAARFMIDRLNLYPSDALFVQRDVNLALKRYVAAQERTPAANPAEIAYARALTDFYDSLYAARGDYQEMRPFLNVDTRELPAVVVTGAAAAAYAVTLGMSSSGE